VSGLGDEIRDASYETHNVDFYKRLFALARKADGLESELRKTTRKADEMYERLGVATQEAQAQEQHMALARNNARLALEQRNEARGQVEAVRALADEWAQEVSSDEQSYVMAAAFRGVARAIYKATGGSR
jgi:hypothetical protein